MVKSIKNVMTRFFIDHAGARKITYGVILSAWLVLMLINASGLKETLIVGSICLLAGVITYYFMGFGTTLFRLFTNKLGIYQWIYWYGLAVSIGCLFAMATPNSRMKEADLLVFVGLATSLSARSIYIHCQKLNKKKN